MCLTYACFKYQGPDRNYQSWTVSDWTAWVEKREPIHKKAAKHRRKERLNEKHSNTVFIASPSDVESAFTGPLDRVVNFF